MYVNYAVIVLLGAFITFLNRNFRLDDALIYYRYIENFINGEGLVYNIGEKFNALTSPLYIFLSVFCSSMTREVEITQLVLNGVLIVAASISLAYLLYSLNKPSLAFLSSVAFISTRYFYTVFGMETNLFLLLSILCIIFYFKKTLFELSISSALLILTRGEGLFLVVLLWGILYYENKIVIKFRNVLIFLSIIAANFLFNYFYYGQLLPHTLTTKMNQSQSGLWGVGHSFVLDYNFLFRIAFNNQSFFVIYISILGLIGFANHAKEKFPLILFIYAVAITVFHVSLNIQNYHWYYAVHFLALVIFVSYGTIDIVRFISARLNKKYLAYIVLGLIFIYPALTQIELFRLLNREGPFFAYKTAGEWLKKNTAPDSKVAGVEVGNVGWYSKRYIVDILGLVTPQLSEYLGKRDSAKWYEIYKPDYIVVHQPLAGPEVLVRDCINKGYYEKETNFEFQGFAVFRKTRSK